MSWWSINVIPRHRIRHEMPLEATQSHTFSHSPSRTLAAHVHTRAPRPRGCHASHAEGGRRMS